MAEVVVASVQAAAPTEWWIAGHSMGAKIALSVAREAENGRHGLGGFAGAVLLAGSPPSPEPMQAKKRAKLLSWIEDQTDRKEACARAYIRENVGRPLDAALEDLAVADVLRANPSAWKAWLIDGSREDCSDTIGVIEASSLVISGTDDTSLGPDAQERLVLPHLAHHRHVVLEGAGHLLPLERPGAVARHLRDAILD